MTVRRPEAAITLGGSALSGPQASMGEVRVDLGVGGAHDRFRGTVLRGSPVADAAPGDAITIELGDADGTDTVLTGEVTAVEKREWGAVVEGLAATAPLSRTRVAQSYLGQTVGAIVDDLVSAGQGTTGRVTATLELSAYHADDRRSVWAHLRELARLAGCELSCDPTGAVDFRPPRTGPADHTLRAGAELLAWSTGPRAPSDAELDVVPYGAASEEGTAKWHLLLKEPEGSSPTGPVLIPAALRAREGATALKDALTATTTRRKGRGQLIAAGDPAIRAGDLVELADMPAGEDATVRATAVTHLFTRAGFVTVLRTEAAA
jgi:hypothetical protein